MRQHHGAQAIFASARRRVGVEGARHVKCTLLAASSGGGWVDGGGGGQAG